MKEGDILERLKGKLKEPEILLKEAKERGVPLEEYLFSKNLVSAEELLEIKKNIYNLPVKKFEPLEKIPNEALAKIPEKTAYNSKVLPLALVNNVLYLGVVDPEFTLTKKLIENLQQTGQSTQIFLISIQDFYKHLEDYYDFSTTLKTLIQSYRGSVTKEVEEEKLVSLSQEILPTEEAPIIKLVETLIRKAVALQASDIHLEPLPDKSRVRFRILGDLQTVAYLPRDVHLSIVNRIKVLTRLRLDETRIPQDGRFRSYVQGREIDFRIGILPTVNGEKVTIRILDPLIGLKNINELGFEDFHLEIIERNLNKAFGMILVTGPTGSGKTTTLYSFINKLNEEDVNIISLEDPVEYRLWGVNQSQIRPEIKYTFASGLREILRQDPDIILVGEIRDEETAQLAIHAALTGHIVITTLHTNTATGAIPRLIDMGVKNYFIPSTVNLVIAQRLARQLCQNCLEPTQINPNLLQEIKKELETAPVFIKEQIRELKFYKGRGCQICGNKGFVGRTGIFEMFEMDYDLGSLILKGASEIEILNKAKEKNFVNLRLHGIIKAIKGLVEIEEVFQIT